MLGFRFNPVLRYREAVRFRQVVNTFLSYGIGVFLESRPFIHRVKRFFRKKHEELPPQVGFRLALESLGPTFIKFGQILSTRHDILPEEWIQELMKLRDEVQASPWNEVEKVLKSELGRDYIKLFSDIEKEPIGSASIAQVHRAVLKTGEEVVLKILRPGVEEVVGTDLNVLKRIAGFIHRHFPEFRIYDFPRLVDEFAFTIKREMDFRVEGANCERIARLLKDEESIVIPKVFWQLTTKRILVLERINGIKLDKWRGDEKKACFLAERLVYSFLKQIIEGDIFHADPHPANILVVDGEKLALLDFGMVGFLDRRMRQFAERVFFCIVSRDYDGIVSEYKRMGIVERMDERRFKMEIMGLVEPYLVTKISRINLGDVVRKIIEISTRYGVRFPSEFLMLARTLLVMDGTVRLLCGEINVLDLVAEYAESLRKRKGRFKIAQEEIKAIRDDLVRAREELRTLLFASADLVHKIREEGIRVKVLQDEIREKEMRALSNRLVASVVSIGFFLGALFAYGLKIGSVSGFPLFTVVLLFLSVVAFIFSLRF